LSKNKNRNTMDIKIAFMHAEYPGGGAEMVTSHLAEYLSARGYRVHLFVEKLNREKLCESDLRNMTFIPVPLFKKDSPAKIAETINSEGIDLLVVPDYGISNFSYIRQHTKCKVVFALHSKPLWEVAGYFTTKAHRAALSGSFGKIATWWLIKYPFEFITRRHRLHRIARYKRNYSNSDLYTVLTDDYKERFIKLLGRNLATPANNHIEVIPNWIPPRDPDSRKPTDKKRRVLFMGRLDYASKRVDRLLDIWAMVWRDFPDWELWIVGDGVEKEHLKDRAQRLRLENVEFHNYTTTPWECYRDASILCLTSTFEGWPLVIAEGQQAGAVPVAFDVSAGVHEQIAPSGENGFLIPPFDKREYARRLAQLMGDEALRGEMSRNVVAKARGYSDKSRLAKWDEAFRKLLTQQ
jgi:glycosyltransferase involved in cell wall biosynthesis